MTGKSVLIKEFLIFQDKWNCICDINLLSYSKGEKGIPNQVLNLSSLIENQAKYKLIMKTFEMMEDLLVLLSFNQNTENLKSFSTPNFKLHYYKASNELLFIFLTEPTEEELNDELKKIYDNYFKDLNLVDEKGFEITEIINCIYDHILNITAEL